jgi:hypothetical protein
VQSIRRSAPAHQFKSKKHGLKPDLSLLFKYQLAELSIFAHISFDTATEADTNYILQIGNSGADMERSIQSHTLAKSGLLTKFQVKT